MAHAQNFILLQKDNNIRNISTKNHMRDLRKDKEIGPHGEQISNVNRETSRESYCLPLTRKVNRAGDFDEPQPVRTSLLETDVGSVLVFLGLLYSRFS